MYKDILQPFVKLELDSHQKSIELYAFVLRYRLEGHADERGTREYNLALGERRAQSIERYLQVQGVSSNQLEVVSYGAEQPVDPGTSEAAYARNRRVEIK